MINLTHIVFILNFVFTILIYWIKLDLTCIILIFLKLKLDLTYIYFNFFQINLIYFIFIFVYIYNIYEPREQMSHIICNPSLFRQKRYT
jgi:hypothetical protein